MVNILTVAPSEMKPVDFNQYNLASTTDIETCIAVATMEQHARRGTLSHLRLTDLTRDFFRFVTNNAPTDSKVYLIGGWKAGPVNIHPMQPQAQSEDYLFMLRQGLVRRGYNITGEDVLNPPGHGCHLHMRYGQPLRILKYKNQRRATGRIGKQELDILALE